MSIADEIRNTIQKGVYAVGHRTLTPTGHWIAAVLACGRYEVTREVFFDHTRFGTEIASARFDEAIEAYREKHDLPLASPRVALVDLQYHDVNRSRSLFYRMQQKNLVERSTIALMAAICVPLRCAKLPPSEKPIRLSSARGLACCARPRPCKPKSGRQRKVGAAADRRCHGRYGAHGALPRTRR